MKEEKVAQLFVLAIMCVGIFNLISNLPQIIRGIPYIAMAFISVLGFALFCFGLLTKPRIPLIFTSLALLVATGSWPHIVYIVVKTISCVSLLFIAYKENESSSKLFFIFSILGAFTMNPIAPMHLEKQLWIFVDIVLAIYVFYYQGFKLTAQQQ